MAEAEIITPTHWNYALTFGLGLMAYFLKRRDKEVDKHGEDIIAMKSLHTNLELKCSETYATKETMMKLFQETGQRTDQAMARVEKRIDETNTAIGRTSDKMDKVIDNIGLFQQEVMKELVKKT